MITIFEKLDKYFLSNWRLAVLDLNKGLWSIEPKATCIPYLKAENANGRHILIQPEEPSTYILADDLSDSLLSAHHKHPDVSFKPGRMIIETSPHNFQRSGSTAKTLFQSIRSDFFSENSKATQELTPTTASEDVQAFATEKKNTKPPRDSSLLPNLSG